MGTEGDVQYFVFPQAPGKLRLYLSYATSQKNRFAGEGNERRVLDAFRLDGRVAVITGGARGIGYATAQLFTAAGARTVLLVTQSALALVLPAA